MKPKPLATFSSFASCATRSQNRGDSALSSNCRGAAAASRAAAGQSERENRRPGRHADMLDSVHQVRHRPGLPVLPGVEVPQRLSVVRVRRDKRAVAIAIEDQAAGGRHQAAAQNPAADVRDLPGRFSGLNVDRFRNFPP